MTYSPKIKVGVIGVGQGEGHGGERGGGQAERQLTQR